MVIPHYNRPKQLARAIDSVRTAQKNLVEIVVVDDGSVVCPVAALPCKNRDGITIRFFKLSKNKGAQAARNLGIRRAKFRYIAFLDSDDEFHSAKIDIMLEALADHPVDLVFHASTNLDRYNKIASTWSVHLKRFIPFYWLIVFLNPVATPTLVIRRCNKLGIESLRHAEDWAYLLRYVDEATTIKYISQELSLIHQDEHDVSRLSHSFFKMRKGEFVARNVLLRSWKFKNMIRWVIGTLVGLMRILSDLRKI